MNKDKPVSNKLRDKQRRFVDEYLRCWNATQAAKFAGYSQKTAAVIGSENLAKDYIRNEVDKRIIEIQKEHPLYGLEFQNTRRIRRDSSIVYLIRASNGLVKIGRTTDIVSRFNVLNVGSPLDLTLLFCIESIVADEIEENLHIAFSDKCVKGEWFALTDDDIESIKNDYIR